MTATCFLCLGRLRDGREIITVGMGFDVHKECYETPDDENYPIGSVQC